MNITDFKIHNLTGQLQGQRVQVYGDVPDGTASGSGIQPVGKASLPGAGGGLSWPA